MRPAGDHRYRLPEGELFQLPIRLNITLTRATVVGSEAALRRSRLS
jgi:hypothetical protein